MWFGVIFFMSRFSVCSLSVLPDKFVFGYESLSVNRGRLRATPQHSSEATEVLGSYIANTTSTIVEELYGYKGQVIKYFFFFFVLYPRFYTYSYATLLLPCSN